MKPFIENVARALGIERMDMIEKDIILHKILLAISEDDFLSNHFLFKGGTCLIKCYLGYYRFSEDIDFTWRDQEVFDGMSQKDIRGYLGQIIDDIGKKFEYICEREGLDFVADKSNRKYVELGGSNKIATFKVWYDSEILKHETFVKIQINFVEHIIYKPMSNELKGLLSNNSELEILFPLEYTEYSKPISLFMYDIREIFCEKVRAILTRRGTKARDFLDLYLISKAFNIEIRELEEHISEKTLFILNLYEKYRKNLAEKNNLIETEKIFTWGREKTLLLFEIDENEFYDFLISFVDILKGISNQLLTQMKKDISTS